MQGTGGALLDGRSTVTQFPHAAPFTLRHAVYAHTHTHMAGNLSHPRFSIVVIDFCYDIWRAVGLVSTGCC